MKREYQTNVENPDFTKSELKVIRLIFDGLKSKEISEELSISLFTVNAHRRNILEKAGTTNFVILRNKYPNLYT